MHGGAMSARAVHPRAHGALVEPARRHDGLRRAAVCEQDQHHGHQPGILVQPVVRRPRRGAQRVTAGRAAVAPRLLTMDAAVACADPPLVGTGLRGAKYGGRVHACCSPGRVDRTRLLIACRIRPVLVILAPFHTLTGLYRDSARGTFSTLYLVILLDAGELRWFALVIDTVEAMMPERRWHPLPTLV